MGQQYYILVGVYKLREHAVNDHWKYVALKGLLNEWDSLFYLHLFQVEESRKSTCLFTSISVNISVADI